MGKWAQSQFDKVLVTKIRELFAYCSVDKSENLPFDDERRFKRFIETLDTENKPVQACFRSLVEQTSRTSFTRRYPHPYSRRLDDQQAGPSRSRQIRSDSAVLPAHPVIPDNDLASPRIFDGLRSDLTSPDPIALSPRPRRRSHSPSHSPSRVRSLALAAGPRPATSPPHSPSQAWLDEYSLSARPSRAELTEEQSWLNEWEAEAFGQDFYGASIPSRGAARRSRPRDARQWTDMEPDEPETARMRHEDPYYPPGMGRTTRTPILRRRPVESLRRTTGRDTRRDRVVFEGISPVLPSSNMSAGAEQPDQMDVHIARRARRAYPTFDWSLGTDSASGQGNDRLDEASYIDFSLNDGIVRPADVEEHRPAGLETGDRPEAEVELWPRW